MDIEEFKKLVTKAREENNLLLGADSTIKSLKVGKVKLVAFAANCPVAEDIKYYARLAKVETVSYPDSGISLGELCRKPFSVSALAVVK